MENTKENHTSDEATNRTEHDHDKDESGDTTTFPIQPPTEMKLIVRSQYWGRVLKGKTFRQHGRKDFKVIPCQAVLTNEGQFWGCCPHHGKRVLDLTELHFADHHKHDWDLYMVGTSVTQTHIYHNFFLLPQNQSVIDIDYNMRVLGWSFYGKVSTSMLRMELGGLVHDLLKQNKQYGYRYHHVHIDILMDKVYDRETPRSRKAANQMARAEKSSDSKTSETSSTKTEAAVPNTKNQPVPSVISNDHSWETQTSSHSSSATSVCYDHLNPPFHPYYYPNMLAEPSFQWHPATIMPQMTPPSMDGYNLVANMPPSQTGFMPYQYQDPSMMMTYVDYPPPIPYPQDMMMIQYHPEYMVPQMPHPEDAKVHHKNQTETTLPCATGSS